ncbi:MAG TPA: right-handed parallel beta-helix repeat-containing protein [Oligoflexia bacterium]|nr:right-handed parallel beta-helix repeat-containing protein [Oligoflexia bacterium]HMP27883.1 right-handed parallel beta-helix repeat-containing protein [Oligoflexia bacterium]
MRKILIFLFICASDLLAQELNSNFYQIGSPNLIEYYVNPSSGNDSNSGLSPNSPKRTISSIWNSLPANLTQGVKINLAAGVYNSEFPNYWEGKHGSANAPIILRGADGTLFERDINMADVRYFYLLNVEIQNRVSGGYGDSFHCERCHHILLRSNSFNGAPNGLSVGSIAHETVKFNQSSHIYIESNDIQGAGDNGIDFVAVQYGSIRGNKIHKAHGWCAYVKGGSSYITIEGNYVYDCGEGGITAGQGTGFEFMEIPWIRYETNYVKIVNNVLFNVWGAALGINGGYNILVAHNTAYRVGQRSHLLEVVFGGRSCDGNVAHCSYLRSQGGWGPVVTGSEEPVGNRHVFVYNNIFYNPLGHETRYQHFAVYGPRLATVPGLAPFQRSDLDLRIGGNWIWNGSHSHPLGVGEEGDGCRGDNPTCNVSQLLTDNYINQAEPEFRDPNNADFRPRAGGNIFSRVSLGIPDLAPLDGEHNPIPEGLSSNVISRDFSGASYSNLLVGAFSSSDAEIQPPPGSGFNTPPLISNVRVRKSYQRKQYQLAFSARVGDSDGVVRVFVLLLSRSLNLRFNGRNFVGKVKFKTKRSQVRYRLRAVDTRGLAAEISRRVRLR